MNAKQRVRGVVKWFKEQKGYGFIKRSDDGVDVFVHHTGIAGQGYKNLTEGDEVEFDVVNGEKGEKAINVAKI